MEIINIYVNKLTILSATNNLVSKPTFRVNFCICLRNNEILFIFSALARAFVRTAPLHDDASKALTKIVQNVQSLGQGIGTLVALVTGVQETLLSLQEDVKAVRSDLARLETKLDLLTGRPARDG